MKKLTIIIISLIAFSAFGYLAVIHYIGSHYEAEHEEDEGQLPETLAGEWGSFQLIGAPYKASNNVIAHSPRIVVDTVDAWFVIPVQIEKVVQGRSPYRERSTVLLKVHSPSLMGLEMNKRYVFTVNGDKDTKKQWQYYLTDVNAASKLVN